MYLLIPLGRLVSPPPRTSIGRITQCIPGRSATTWHQLVADDIHLAAGGGHYRAALTTFFVLCATAGIPLSWCKTSGGDVAWVGFELRRRSFQLGISERRAWIINWTKKIAASTSVNVSTFEEGLGRVMYVAGAQEYKRPFLGPLYGFMSLHPRNSVRLFQAHVKFFLSHFATQLELCRHYSCAMEIHSWETAPRVDVQASEERTGKSWAPVMNSEGKLRLTGQMIVVPQFVACRP